MPAPESYAYYVDGSNCTDYFAYPNNCRKLAEDVVAAIDHLVDFSVYDNDNDGWMEPIMLIHAGPGAEFTGDPDDIWSHSWSMVIDQYFDSVWISDYVIMPEYMDINEVSATSSDQTIGVFAHEMGHGFWDLPDLYDEVDFAAEQPEVFRDAALEDEAGN